MKIFRLLSLLSLVFFSTCAAMQVEPGADEEKTVERVEEKKGGVVVRVIPITAQNFEENRLLLAELGPVYAAAFFEEEKKILIKAGTFEEGFDIAKFLEEEWQKDIKKLEKNLKGKYPEDCIFVTVSTEHDELIGFAKIYLRSQDEFIRILADEDGGENITIAPIAQALRDGLDAYIECIEIKPEHAHKGFGTLLMNTIQMLPRIRLIYFEVFVDNGSAINFYTKLGFMQQGSYLHGGVNYYICSKIIRGGLRPSFKPYHPKRKRKLSF
ncbi:MAG: GNAT family N-acetyltransferase [Candidatus Babeliales bacterium]|jgi:ribosomal protein S18 acetylase RimI-like enzyme